MSEQDNISRERIQYEYLIYSTPKYTAEPIDESYEVHKVIHSYLNNGHHNFIIVFRRPYPNTKSKVDHE